MLIRRDITESASRLSVRFKKSMTILAGIKMTQPNLTDLINMKGFGNAAKVLQKSGHWDEYAGAPYKKYYVTFAVMVSEERGVTVSARSEYEADKLAYKDISTDADVHECSDEAHHIEELT